MTSITALIITSLLLFGGTKTDVIRVQRFYEIVLPLLFFAVSFALYIGVIFIKQLNVLPWAYLKLLMTQHPYKYANDQARDEMMGTYTRVADSFKTKAVVMRLGSSFFLVGLGMFIAVNVFPLHKMHTWSYSIPVLLLILGVDLAILIWWKVFTSEEVKRSADLTQLIPAPLTAFIPVVGARPPVVNTEPEFHRQI